MQSQSDPLMEVAKYGDVLFRVFRDDDSDKIDFERDSKTTNREAK